MYCTKKITNDLTWVGGNDRRLAMFEGVYSVPDGVSYNSYLLIDDVTVLFDTADKAVRNVFFDNIEHTLGQKKLNYIVVHHMEPDHSAILFDVLQKYPEAVVVCNAKTADMMKQFFPFDSTIDDRFYLVKEGSTLNTGHHTLTFYMAPMVHWPEVMVSYDTVDKILFSADAFGTFGALNGAIFADEVDFERDYMDEARRYYCNIVGKYGAQTQALLKKAASLDIKMICPLHGFVWRNDIDTYLDKYQKWSTYTPEETGVMIAYASVYGNTENAAEIIACRLRDAGIKTVMFDVSVTPASDIIAAAFRWSHLVFASTTYNNGIFVSMEALLHDLAAHNIQNRTVALIQNGSWAPASEKLMQQIFAECKNIHILEQSLTLRSSLKESQGEQLDALVSALVASAAPSLPAHKESIVSSVDEKALFKLTYGLFVLSAREGEKDNGCIINTAMQITANPIRIAVAVNKQNYTHDMIIRTGKFNLSALSESVPFSVFEQFGFQSGSTADKFADCKFAARSDNGIYYLSEYTNSFLSGQVTDTIDCGTHTIFIAEVTQAQILSAEESVTYAYYFAHIKPKPQNTEKKKGYICKICGYIYEGDELPDDFICPLCKHGAEDFEPLE